MTGSATDRLSRVAGRRPPYPPSVMESSDALNSPAEPRWKVRIDTGGTFTDAVAIDPTGVASRRKVLSSGRVRGRLRDGIVVLADGSAAPSLLAGAEVRGLPGDAPLGHLGDGGRLGAATCLRPTATSSRSIRRWTLRSSRCICSAAFRSDRPSPIELRVATTRGTNALLTRSTGRVLLVTTTGFEDLPVIGDQTRPDLFDLDIRPPRLLPAATIGVPRHVDATVAGSTPSTSTGLSIASKRRRSSMAWTAWRCACSTRGVIRRSNSSLRIGSRSDCRVCASPRAPRSRRRSDSCHGCGPPSRMRPSPRSFAGSSRTSGWARSPPGHATRCSR